ncbi:nucleotidyltransferase domain-containing protein [Pseudomonas leptonychotis]|uniref:Nucleotidyltransferase domain-containing protein n=1 Tax=Pseudomonas leptonychotis TaxID=2448482 RepID=A0A4T1ZW88_9PSED|nr:nucleotidyltransferase domain-containing protein [Pseudomonas leptonychotis]TIH07031.1 nucleotidyltransferase domain-containing protein [Pseudomonas leptonychotis]
MDLHQQRHPLSAEMREWVLRELKAIEAQHEVTVLYACESGSRAWGFASPDSDYDVRFVYVQRQPWYLRVDAPRDVIERPLSDELDIGGWELRKTLHLLRKSNPTLLEWLDSPLVYRSESGAAEQLRELAEQFYCPTAARHHYLSMAKKNFRGYLQDEQVRFKKYLYVLRPLLAVRWIDQGLGRPPMTFAALLDATVRDPTLLAEIDALLTLKRQVVESAYGPRREAIHAFIEQALQQAEAQPALPKAGGDTADLDRYLCETVLRYS